MLAEVGGAGARSEGMGHAGFVHLRVHTAFSLSQGAIAVSALAQRCREMRMPAVAITDTDNMFGAVEASRLCAAAGVQPIIGCELALAGDDERPARDPHGAPADRIVLLAQNEAGYRNLIALSSAAYLESEAAGPRIGAEALAARAGGLIALTGGAAGPIGRLLAAGRPDAARGRLARLAEMFPGRLYMELQRHGLDEEAAAEPGMVALADEAGLPLVATNEAFFATPDMHEAHDALLCIAHGAYVPQADRPRVSPRHDLKSAEDMRALFADLPDAIDNTLAIARRCAFRVVPRAPLLPTVPNLGEHADEAAMLRRAAEAGLERRLEAGAADPAPYRERLAYELDVIVRMGFAGYFLIVADFVQWAKAQGIAVGPGRGSGAGSAVSWALSITDLDPLRFGLLFERFLNPDRVSMPDFDIDFCQERRDEVIRYVQRQYGEDRVAQIAALGKLQARAAVRDVGRVLQMPYGQVDRLCKLIPQNPANPVSLGDAIDSEPQLREARDGDPEVARLMRIALRLEGLYRHASTHAAGVVIGDRPLDELVPLYRDPRSVLPVTQFNMKDVETVGLVKFDFLGLKTLTVLQRAEEMLARRGAPADLADIPLDDAATFAMLSRGDTVGVFQFESPGMRNLLREAGAGAFEDMVALVALFRPGPMENIPKYIACKHGREKPEFLHETIAPIVRETYGVIVYQEQVMEIAQKFAGYTLGQADLLRRAMGKKIKAEMAAQRETFVGGAMARGVERARASHVFDLVDKFAGYGFNKAHSVGYALVAYRTAWLKANRPVEFFAASMSLDRGNPDKLNVFRQELERAGIALLPPDINVSGADFAVEAGGGGGDADAIRYALAAIRNVGAAAMERVVEERERNGPFKDLFDFAGRVDPAWINKRQLENLARAGAFDSLDPNRRRAAEAAETLLRRAAGASAERRTGQSNLFGEAVEEASAPQLPEVADWPAADRLAREFEALGFYLSAHPLDGYEAGLSRLGATPFAALADNGAARATLAGVVLARRERNSRRGRAAFLQMSDRTAMFEVSVFAECRVEERELLEPGRMLLVEAAVQRDGDRTRLSAQRIESLDARATRECGGFRVFVAEDIALAPLSATIARERGRGPGYARMTLVAPFGGTGEVEIALDGAYLASPAARAALKSIPGVREVRELEGLPGG